MPNASPFCDASDRPEASEWPSFDVDGPLDHALELIGKIAVELPAGISRSWFDAVAAKLFIEMNQKAAAEDRLGDLYDGAEPSKADKEMTARLLAEICGAENPVLQAKCMQVVLGMTDESQTEIARKTGVGKAAVSKRCVMICKAFGLPPSRGMKSERARKAYADRQQGKIARPKRTPWAYANLLTQVYAKAA